MMTPSFLTLTLIMMRVGLLGMRRRIADYDPALGFDGYHFLMTIAGFLIAISVAIFLFNLLRSVKRGEPATGNIWNSRSRSGRSPRPCRRTISTGPLRSSANPMTTDWQAPRTRDSYRGHTKRTRTHEAPR